MAQKFKIEEGHLAGLQARASVLALAESDPARRDRHFDDAHDLLNLVQFLLQDNGLDLIEDPATADYAFATTHIGIDPKTGKAPGVIR